jgi:hypothetical protein
MHFLTRFAILIWIAFFAWIVTVLIACLLAFIIWLLAFPGAFFIGSLLIGYAARQFPRALPWAGGMFGFQPKNDRRYPRLI